MSLYKCVMYKLHKCILVTCDISHIYIDIYIHTTDMSLNKCVTYKYNTNHFYASPVN